MNSVREQIAGAAYVRRALGDDRDDDRGELGAALSAAALEARWRYGDDDDAAMDKLRTCLEEN